MPRGRKKTTLMHLPRRSWEARIKFNPDCEDCLRERQERRVARAKGLKTKKPLTINASRQEYEQIALAASLRRLSIAEYVKRALNASLVREGVDAVLFREREL